MDGILNVYKEKGYSSHDVVAKLRGILQMKRIGHTGTLDPDAEGVLVVCIGKGTKLTDMITDKDKSYKAILKLGITTDTQDLSGNIIKTGEVRADRKQIEDVIKSFIGEYMQLPPMYSAIKVGGKKLYEYARQGEEVERERRRVHIKDIKILEHKIKDHEITMLVDCSKGTYIRTLLHDIGESLGCGGAMKELTRIRVGSFDIDNALKLSEISRLVENDKFKDYLIPMEDIFPSYSKVIIQREHNKLVHNGNVFNAGMIKEQALHMLSEYVRVYDADNVFIGIYCFDQDGKVFKPVKMLL
jgi:tRNA pseudouridine55 synthase